MDAAKIGRWSAGLKMITMSFVPHHYWYATKEIRAMKLVLFIQSPKGATWRRINQQVFGAVA